MLQFSEPALAAYVAIPLLSPSKGPRLLYAAADTPAREYATALAPLLLPAHRLPIVKP